MQADRENARSRRVAIVQPTMIMGGRLQAVLTIIRTLNQLGIVPDVLSYRFKFDPADIMSRYSAKIEANFKKRPMLLLLPGEFSTARFNAELRFIEKRYDLLINNSNSLLFLPRRANVLTYMYFPRKYRVMADVANIHDGAARPFRRWSRYGVYNLLERALYRLSGPVPHHGIICISEFARKALVQAYPKLACQIPVIHPPVPLHHFLCEDRERPPVVISVGRFESYKGQLQQIRLATRLPDLTFHIVGFVADKRYFEKCRSFIEANGITNVHLYPNAPFAQMVSLLKTSRYFLHTTVNEPFGVTAVQATAAGCIPLVHDSGGQRETVPLHRLRFQDVEDVAGIIGQLESEGPEQLTPIVEEMQAHIHQYDEANFMQRMREALMERLDL